MKVQIFVEYSDKQLSILINSLTLTNELSLQKTKKYMCFAAYSNISNSHSCSKVFQKSHKKK